ncbi:TIMELESS-interacting protein isoform X2 [Denticeps clupeoides]|uniref:TIMELESS-interacting protein isoform X2 n=2 Tax=Denticeps clupeoides TaxID=299321 RepID=UPI0010A44150|nr:TIMELESS-interacting protein isoform X2 [Denticeps clupeoides]
MVMRKEISQNCPMLQSPRGEQLTSERGLPALRTLFDDVRFRGKGHEAEDLRVLMQKMENWAHRLYPKMQFEEFIDKVEFLGSKKEVQTCLKRIRLDMPLTHEDFNTKEDEREDCLQDEHVSEELDPFADGGFRDDHIIHSTPASLSLTEEQRHRIELNKQQALERRLARQQQQQGASQPVDREEPSDHSPTVSSQENDLHVPGTEETEKPQQPVRATRPASPLFDDECYSPAAELANGTADSSD